MIQQATYHPRLFSRSKPGMYLLRATARALFFAYTLFLLKPVMPILTDGLAHTFWNNIHVAIVHKVNGVEHVHYELLKNAKELEKEKGGAKGKVMDDDAPYCTTTAIHSSTTLKIRYGLQQNIICEAFYADAFPAHDYPPPKA